MKEEGKSSGTEADDSHSTLYFSNCYRNGRFTHPDLDARQV